MTSVARTSAERGQTQIWLIVLRASLKSQCPPVLDFLYSSVEKLRCLSQYLNCHYLILSIIKNIQKLTVTSIARPGERIDNTYCSSNYISSINLRVNESSVSVHANEKKKKKIKRITQLNLSQPSNQVRTDNCKEFQAQSSRNPPKSAKKAKPSRSSGEEEKKEETSHLPLSLRAERSREHARIYTPYLPIRKSDVSQSRRYRRANFCVSRYILSRSRRKGNRPARARERERVYSARGESSRGYIGYRMGNKSFPVQRTSAPITPLSLSPRETRHQIYRRIFLRAVFPATHPSPPTTSTTTTRYSSDFP